MVSAAHGNLARHEPCGGFIAEGAARGNARECETSGGRVMQGTERGNVAAVMPFQFRISGSSAATHQLRLPDGSLEPLHGHGWHVEVTLAADQLDAMDCVI